MLSQFRLIPLKQKALVAQETGPSDRCRKIIIGLKHSDIEEY